MDCMETMDIVLIQVIKPEHTGGTHMKNSAALKRQMRYQQWVEEVKDFNARPKDMTVREWCAIHDIKPPTFYDHLRRVQDYYAGQIQSSEASNQMVVSEPAFVELPAPVPTPKPVTHGVASIICGNARIEISEDISEAFLLKLIGAISHAQ